jgi:hypothetical protein
MSNLNQELDGNYLVRDLKFWLLMSGVILMPVRVHLLPHPAQQHEQGDHKENNVCPLVIRE